MLQRLRDWSYPWQRIWELIILDVAINATADYIDDMARKGMKTKCSSWNRAGELGIWRQVYTQATTEQD